MFKEKTGKLEYRLIPPESLKAVAEVLAFGNTKYAPFSWALVPSEDYVDAIYRHLAAARLGEVNDKESGLSHLAHAITNLMFLLDRQQCTEESVMSFEQEMQDALQDIFKEASKKSKGIVEEDEEGNQTIFIGD